MELTTRKSNAKNYFKAGDFTSGKMSEIYRQCFQGMMAYIDHKQFGRAYLVPEVVVAGIAVDRWMKVSGVKKYLKAILVGDESFHDLDIEAQFHYIEDFYEADWIDWAEALRSI